ncbi:putative adenylyltransferase/sulfurtransferase MoeZ [compost metagenome]
MAFKIAKEITPQALATRLNNGESLMIIDVREPQEWNEAHIAGAKHIQLGQLLERLDELDSTQEMFMVCRSGSRSGLACEMLNERGFDVVNMKGGLSAWTDKLV